MVNKMWLVLEETSPSSSSRVDDTVVDVPKETRPILGHLGVFNFPGNLPLPSRILSAHTNGVSLCCLPNTRRQPFPGARSGH